MATYISLVQYTDKGMASIAGSPGRVDEARKLYASMGATLKEFFLVMGEYDIVIIAEAPNDDVVAKLSLTLGAKGNVRTRTMRAFTEDEFRNIVGSLGT